MRCPWGPVYHTPSGGPLAGGKGPLQSRPWGPSGAPLVAWASPTGPREGEAQERRWCRLRLEEDSVLPHEKVKQQLATAQNTVLAQAAITRHHKLGGLTQMCLSSLWRLRVQAQGASMIGFREDSRRSSQMATFLPCPPVAERDEASLSCLFLYGHHPPNLIRA